MGRRLCVLQVARQRMPWDGPRTVPGGFLYRFHIEVHPGERRLKGYSTVLSYGRGTSRFGSPSRKSKSIIRTEIPKSQKPTKIKIREPLARTLLRPKTPQLLTRSYLGYPEIKICGSREPKACGVIAGDVCGAGQEQQLQAS